MIVRRKYGRKLYTAKREGGYGCYRLYPLGKGKRLGPVVKQTSLVPATKSEAPVVVQTQVGKVRVPKNWHRYKHFSGSSRRTYLGQAWVFKVPIGYWGIEQNQFEAARWALQSGGSRKGIPRAAIVQAGKYGKKGRNVPVAECYLLPCGTLMMERVRPLVNLMNGKDKIREGEPGFLPRHEYPEWATHVDSEQIGYNRSGELVAYDI